jgi:multicomponent Na+:H+ antiporter subunit D
VKIILAHLPALLIVIPLLSAPVCACFSRRKIAWFFTSLICLTTFLISFKLLLDIKYVGVIRYALGGWEAPIGIEYKIDHLSGLFLVLISFIAVICSLYGKKMVKQEVQKDKHPLFYALFLLCLTGMLGIIITNDFFNIYVFLEISSLSTYALVAMGQEKGAPKAAFDYLIIGTIAATFILLGIGLLLMHSGTLNIDDFKQSIKYIFDLRSVKAGIAFIIIGIFIKMAVFPLHTVLVNAYSNAPSMISSFLAGASTKVGIYLLIRIIYSVFGEEKIITQMKLELILQLLGGLAVLIGSYIALQQENFKKLLAFSSISQIGYIMIAISLGTIPGLIAALIFTLYHAIAKTALFMIAGSFPTKELNRFNSLKKEYPLTCMMLAIAFASLIGVPLTAGFTSKFLFVMALIDKQAWTLLIVILLGVVLSVSYSWKVLKSIYMDPVHEENIEASEVIYLLIPIIFMSMLIVWFGINSNWLFNYVNIAIRSIIAL